MQAVESGAVVQVPATELLPPSPRRPVSAPMSYRKQVGLGLGGHLSMATPSVTGSSGEDEWPL